MDEALEADKAWEDLHGPHTIAKKYVPPFSTDEMDQFEKENGRPPDFNEIGELLHLKDDDAENQGPPIKDINPTSLRLPDGAVAAAAHQIHDMRYIYLKVRNLYMTDRQLNGAFINEGFHAEVRLPLPDVKAGEISTQQVVLRNYEHIATTNQDGKTRTDFVFNSTSSFHFSVSEATLADFAEASLRLSLHLPVPDDGKAQA